MKIGVDGWASSLSALNFGTLGYTYTHTYIPTYIYIYIPIYPYSYSYIHMDMHICIFTNCRLLFGHIH